MQPTLTLTGAIGIVSTKSKQYVHTKKGFYRNGKYIKAKKTIKVKQVPIKNPYLSLSLFLKTNEVLSVGCPYMDEHGEFWMCTQSMNITEPESILLNLSMKPKDNIFFPPTKLTKSLYHSLK